MSKKEETNEAAGGASLVATRKCKPCHRIQVCRRRPKSIYGRSSNFDASAVLLASDFRLWLPVAVGDL